MRASNFPGGAGMLPPSAAVPSKSAGVRPASAGVLRGFGAVVLSMLTIVPMVHPSYAAEPPAPAASTLEVVPATAAQVLDAVKKSGSRAVIVNLWATWCTPCREEFPDLMRVYQAFKDRGVSLVLVSGDFSSDADPFESSP
jgi:thiol-disulfide isomerase/thioredoxin